MHSFIGLVKYLFTLPVINDKKLAFLSNNLCQDPLKQFFGCQRQRGGTSDNPNVLGVLPQHPDTKSHRLSLSGASKRKLLEEEECTYRQGEHYSITEKA